MEYAVVGGGGVGRMEWMAWIEFPSGIGVSSWKEWMHGIGFLILGRNGMGIEMSGVACWLE